MTRFWFVRHGPTHAKVMVGWTDIAADLSDTATLTRLRAALPDAPVVSSDLVRAIATADALEPRHRLPHDPRLREINFGDWEMRSFAEVEAETPALIRAYWEQPGETAPPNGESWHNIRARMNTAIDDYALQGHADLIVVAHFGAILTQVQRAFGISAYQAFGQRIDNLSVTQLTHDAGAWSAGPINQIP